MNRSQENRKNRKRTEAETLNEPEGKKRDIQRGKKE